MNSGNRMESMHSPLTRRTFLKGSAVALATLATIPAFGCSSSTASKSTGKLADAQNLTMAAGRSYYEGPTYREFLHKNANVWEGLVTLDSNLQIVYVLAKSMAVSDDGLSWHVELVDNAVFHDGTKFNADIAIENMDRSYHFDDDHYDAQYSDTSNFGSISSFSKTGDYSFDVRFSKPCFDFDYKISYLYSAMLCPSCWGSDEKKVATTCIGTGPFKLDSFDKTSGELVVVKNSDYRLGAPTLERITFKKITDSDTRLAALQNGEVDVIADTGGIIPAQTTTVSADSNLVLQSTPITITLYAYMNTNEGMSLSDPILRQAISLCINRESICKDLLLGYGTPGSSVITPVATLWHKDENYEYDVDKAKQLVQKAYSGKDVAIDMVLGASSDRWPFGDIATVMKSDLAKAGITLNIETLDNKTQTARMKAKTYDISIMQHSLSTGEPNFFFANHMASTGAQTKARGTGINDSQVDALCAQATATKSYEDRKKIYDQLQDIAKEKYYILPVWHEVAPYAYNKKISGFSMDPIFWADLAKVSVLAG